MPIVRSLRSWWATTRWRWVSLQTSSGSADLSVATGDGRGALTGIAAGVIGLACCVGPAVAALLGVTSATVAVDLSTDLYSDWGWAFKLAGALFATTAIVLAVRRARACNSDRRGVLRFGTIIVVAAGITYGLLYAGTTWLGTRAT